MENQQMLKRAETIESKTAKPLSLWASRSAKIGPKSALEEIQINIIKGPGHKVVWQLRPILPSSSYIWLCCSNPIVPKWLQFFNFIEFQFAWNKNLCIFQEIQTSIKNISKSWYFPLAYVCVYMLQWVCILFYYFCLFIHSSISPTSTVSPDLWQPPICSLHLWVWCLFCLDSTYQLICTVFVFLLDVFHLP